MYYATFHWNLIYAIQIYSCTYKSNLLPLVKKQKAAARIVNNPKYNDHSEPIFKSLRILPYHCYVISLNYNLCRGSYRDFSLSLLTTPGPQTELDMIISQKLSFVMMMTFLFLMHAQILSPINLWCLFQNCGKLFPRVKSNFYVINLNLMKS